MPALETLIREAADTGRLDGLTLWKTSQGWQANVRRRAGEGWNVVIDADPIRAVLGALGQQPAAPTEPNIFD